MLKIGWYIVPDGVTAITVEAVYGRAIYIRSPYDTMYYDEYKIFYYGENDDGTTTLTGEAVAKSSDDNYGTSSSDAVATLKGAYARMDADSSLTVYDTVFVLCGPLYEINYNTTGNSYATGTAGTYTNYSSSYFGYNSSKTKPVTITSEQGENYDFYLSSQTYDLTNTSSLRLDSVTLHSLSTDNMVSIHGIATSTYAKGRQFNFSTSGTTFETTENLVSEDTTVQIRLRSAKYFKLNGGKWNPCWNYSATTGTTTENSYIQIGGLACITYVTVGGTNNSSSTEYIQTGAPSIVVTGGKITTGIYGTSYCVYGSVKGDVHIFISGGNIANIYGGGNGNTYASDSGDEKGDVNITIYGGTIGTLYGGGQYYTSTIAGDVNITIENATITGNVYGGGKGGKISGNVNLSIDNSTISGTVFGGGLGLTDTVTETLLSASSLATSGWDTAVTTYNTSASSNDNVEQWDDAPTGFPIYNDETKTIVTRKYHSASLSSGYYYLREYQISSSLTLAEIYGNVNMNLADSNIGGDVYGGGSISLVYGDVDLNIENCTISGNIYGGGDGVTTPATVELYIPIASSSYTELEYVSKTINDSNTSIGAFTWTNDERILTYFGGIYDGANKVVYDGTADTTSFDELLAKYDESSTEYAEITEMISTYGNKQLIYSGDAESLRRSSRRYNNNYR